MSRRGLVASHLSLDMDPRGVTKRVAENAPRPKRTIG